ncbi:Hydantoinase B/oxoprolinase [Xylaria arbuscula]|nr:Hydantoinase B/oxoprolinase [Xylaria arbuscula]
MAIAEQMGRTLQKTSVSTNVKERLDFSCAMFSPDGGLVANAPHVPVHLGSMQFCVKHMHELWKGKLEEGDVLVSNHPSQGGTHLPDITVVTPVFDNGEIVFYVASRGYHTDIGETRPGLMPPDSRWLYEEGAAILGEKGRFNEERIVELRHWSSDIGVPNLSILSPALGASAVGGNVLTSQRITDVILTAFSACTDSQGCMNNLTFGIGGKRINSEGEEVVKNGFGYYETIGGGAGAGPSWVGSSGVHTHMANTRITDPEIFEKRYPVLPREFSITQSLLLKQK